MVYGDGHCAVCGADAWRGLLMCRWCWRQVPRELQGRVRLAWSAYKARPSELNLRKLRGVQERACESVERP